MFENDETYGKKAILGQVFDSEQEIFYNGYVLTEGEKIVETGPAENLPSCTDMKIIDTKGKYIVPGLIDGHNHLYLDPGSFQLMSESSVPDLFYRMIRNAQQHVHDGVTAMRECGTPHFLDGEVKKMIDGHVIDGPTLMTCGEWITASNGHGSFEGCAQIADGEWEIRKAVRTIVRHNVDYIKVRVTGGNATVWAEPGHNFYSLDELRALVDEAKANGKEVGAHCHSELGAKYAVEAGVTMLEHGSLLTSDEIINLLKEHNIIWTFNQHQRFADPDPRVPAYKLKRTREGRDKSIIAVKKALKAGITICAGCDGYHANSAFVWALEGMVKSGATSKQALIIGTKNPGKAFFKGERGILKAGTYADIIVSEENPQENISALRNLKLVIKNGKVVRDELDKA